MDSVVIFDYFLSRNPLGTRAVLELVFLFLIDSNSITMHRANYVHYIVVRNQIPNAGVSSDSDSKKNRTKKWVQLRNVKMSAKKIRTSGRESADFVREAIKCRENACYCL